MPSGRAVAPSGGVQTRKVDGEAAFGAGGELVFDADVGEGASGHDAVVAAAGAEGVVHALGHAVLIEVAGGGGAGLDRPGGGYVVGRGRVAEHGEAAGTLDRLDRRGFLRKALEERRLLHVGRLLIPVVERPGRGVDGLPLVRALEHVGVAGDELVAGDEVADHIDDLLLGRPDVLEVDVLPVLVPAEGLVLQVDVDGAGDGVGDDEGGRGEVVGFDVRADASLEVAIAREDRAGDKVVFVDGLGDGFGQRAGVTDTGGAAVADEVEAQGVEVVGEAGLGVVVGDDLGAGGEGRF